VAIKLPNDVTKLSADALADLLTQAQTEFDALLALDDPQDADVTEAERLDPIIKTLRAESERRVTAAADRTARMEALRTAPTDPTTPDPDPGPPDPTSDPLPSTTADGGQVLHGEVIEVTPTLYAEDLVQSATESDSEFAARQARYPHREVTEGQQVVQVDPGQLAVQNLPGTQQVTTTAGGFVAQVARNGQRPVTPARSRGTVAIRASADVPEFSTGQVLEDLTQTAKATLSRMQGFPTWTPPSEAIIAAAARGENVEDIRRFGVATFRKPFPEDLVAPERTDAYDTIMNASRESNLPGQSLTAAGGWCAPSEVIYDLCQDETTDGMLSIPEIQVSRGGIKYTQGPDFSTIYDNTGFCQTEAQAISGATKPCYEVPCPAFTEVRLDVCGLCIKVPILTQAGYPELVARVISGAMIAHQHQMNAKVINSIATALGAPTEMPDIGSSAQGTLNAVQLVTEALRSKYRLGFNRAMEVVAPHWLLGAIKADISYRTGVAFASVSDAEVNAALGAAGAAVQWVEDWQGLPNGCPTVWPSAVDLLIYPSGTFIKGTSDVISLNAVYDAASLAVNTYVGLFFEEGILVTRTCYSGCAVTIPLCNAGKTGAADNTECYTAQVSP
jgi:hypothetical protein